LTLIVARSASPTEFGEFGLAFLLAMLALTLVRAAVSVPLSLRVEVGPSQDPASRVPDLRDALGASAVAGVALGLGLVVVGVALQTGIGPSVLALGLSLPALVLQDAWRYAFIVVAKPSRAVANDLVMGALVIGGALVLQGCSVPVLVLIWGASALVACGVAIWQSRVWPALARSRIFLRRHRDLSGWLTAELTVQTGSTYAAMLLLGLTAGTVGLGSLRGAQTLFGPFTALLIGLLVGSVPEARRVAAMEPRRLPPVLRAVSGVLGLATLALSVVLLALPDPVGKAILGDTWPGARALLVPFAAMTAGVAVASGGMVGLRVGGAVRDSFRLRLVVGGMSVVVAPLAGAVGGLQAGAWGLAGAAWVNALGAWWLFRRRWSTADPYVREARA
jgi:O-antigen/teichoic acid export membrane protein